MLHLQKPPYVCTHYQWHIASDDLLKEIMVFNAHGHPHPEMFDIWKIKGVSPYHNDHVNFEERCNFMEGGDRDKQLWSTELLKRKPMNTRKLIQALLKENCDLD